MGISIACIAFENGRLFIAKRENKGDMGNRWEFPGGKLEAGESFEEGIIREMKEEFGVTVTVGKKIAEAAFEHRGKQCSLYAYSIKFPHDGTETPFVLTEHTDYKWIEPEKIPELYFVDSDLKIYPEIMKLINQGLL